MKKTVISILASWIILPLAGCGSKEDTPVLNVYNWDDYMAPEVFELFEEKYGCKVILDTFDSNEAMYAKLKAGASGYDVIFPSSYQAYMMNEEGMLHPINQTAMPNLANVDPEYLGQTAIDKTMAYSVPYMSGSTGLGYRESAVPDLTASWAVFEREDLKGRMTLLDDMREVLGAALKYLGYSLNTGNEAEILEAGNVVIKWKRNIATFESEGYKQGIASREFHVVQGYSGDIMQVIDQNEDEDIVYALPEEGFSVWVDDMVIPADSDNVELAEKFIDFMHDPEIAKLNMEYNYYVCPNSAAYEIVDEELKSDPTIFIPDELMKKSEMIRPIGDDLQKYIKVWDLVKAAP
ncbi:MAG TPA: spermidine/putrescine ABC transporter substrate-binding protein [Oceanipulchritudo sp.]|nr:spermidine/putrescine ABC transporter substrate-binding protein [Oceanipulchritudo sp.]